MLQYFLKHYYPSVFRKGSKPRLEYVCHVDASASTMPRSMHEHKNLVELVLVYHGVGYYMIDGRRYMARKGDIIIYNSKAVHDEFGGTGTELCTYCLAMSGLEIDNLPSDKLLPQKLSPVLDLHEDFDEVLSLFQFVERESKDGQTELANYLARAIVLKVHDLLAVYGKPLVEEETTLAARIRSYLDQNYKEDIHLCDVADALHTSPYYFSHIFKAETGISPMKYVTLRRLGEAQNLLINTSMNITDIASQVGYNNSNYFQNVFRNALGMTPGEYRKKWTI